MFISKLQNFLQCRIPVTRKLHTNIFTCFSCKSNCSKVANKKFQNVKNLISPKCKEYQDKLAKCPKPTHEELCCKPLFPKPEPKCKTKSIETYEQVYEDITNHAKSILKNIEAESKFILNRCKNDVEVLKNKKEAQLQEFSHSVKERLDKLSILDPSAASLKRKCALSLNYQVRQAFTNAQCDIVPKIEKIKQTLKILERDVLICIDRAKTLVALCRKCNNPQRLDKCIEENTETAKQILNDAHKSVQVRLNKIEALRQETLQYHTATTAEVTAIYSKKYKTFLKHLDKCIFTIKNINKQ